MYTIDTKKLHKDILKKLSYVKKPQRHLTEKLNVSRSTFWRLSQGKTIEFETFFILIDWLYKEPNDYIVKLTKKNCTTKN